MARLSSAERKHLPKQDFAVKSKAPGPGSYPEPDPEHAKIAIGLAKMHGGPVGAVRNLAKRKFGIGGSGKSGSSKAVHTGRLNDNDGDED